MRTNDVSPHIELFQVVCIVAVFAMIFVLNSRFILPTGVDVALSTKNNAVTSSTVGTLTVISEKFIILDGDVCKMESLPKEVSVYLKRRGISDAKNLCMLVRADKLISIEVLSRICDTIKSAGYGRIKIAANMQK